MPTLKIKTITNRELSCTYEEDYTVRMLKENIEHKEGMPVDQFKLIYMGQQMDEMKKLSDYKISAGSYIIMVPSLRGWFHSKLLNTYCISIHPLKKLIPHSYSQQYKI